MRRHENAALVVAVAVGTVVRLARVARAPLVHPDAPAYLELAAAWRNHDWIRVLGGYYSPLYPVTVAPLLAVGLPPELAGRLAATLAGVAAIALVWRATRALGPRVAAAAALVVALQPSLVKASAQVLPETLAGALVLAWWIAVDGGAAAFVAAGACAGAAYLARPEGVLLLPLGLVRGARRRGRAALVAYAVVALVLMAPALLALHARSGRWQLSPREEVVLGKRGLGDEPGLAAAAVHHPVRLAGWLVAGAAEQTWNDAVALSPLLWVPFAAGLGTRGVRWPLAVAAAFTWLPLALNPSPRYSVPLLPLLVVPVATGLMRLESRLGRRAAPAAVALGVVLVVQGLWKSHPLDEVCADEVHELLRTHAHPDDALVAVDGRFAWSAGLRSVVPRSTRPDEALALARRQGASLWLTRPQWVPRGFDVPGKPLARPCGGAFVLFALDPPDGDRR